MQLTFTGSEKIRLDIFLREELPEYSRTQIQKIIKDKKVTVNEKQPEVHHWLKKGDSITVLEVPTKQIRKAPAHNALLVPPKILFQSAEFAVVIKPAGLLIHPTEAEETETLAAWVVKTFPDIERVGDDPLRPGIVHRLDKEVGGLILIALTPASFQYFKKLFQEHTITKKYYALVHGIIEKDEGRLETPIERSKKTGRMIAQSATHLGKEAITSYEVMQRFHTYTFLEIQIITGRTHQIRTHFFSIGHSVVGDQLYKTRDIKKQKRDSLSLTRPFLFAYYLGFKGPDGERHEFSIELPDDFKKILSDLQ